MLCDPRNCIVYISSKKNEGKTDLEAPWYSTKYAVQEFSEELLNKMMSPQVDESPALGLPPQNDFIASNFDLLPKDAAKSAVPRLIK
jgi:secreted Zn-dependent insulinase-like peptidase